MYLCKSLISTRYFLLVKHDTVIDVVGYDKLLSSGFQDLQIILGWLNNSLRSTLLLTPCDMSINNTNPQERR